MKFKIITAGRDCVRYLPRYFQSLEQNVQGFDGYEVYLVDDASEAPQADTIRKLADASTVEIRAKFNKERLGAMRNQVAAIASCGAEPDDVLVFVDMDDALAHRNVLTFLASHYADPNLLLTYGNYQPVPAANTCSIPRPYPDAVIAENSYRWSSWHQTGILTNHLRTFRYKLFQHMDVTDWTWPNGEWFQAACDTAMMIPALELAGPRHKVFQEVLLYYSSDNEHSDWRIQPREGDRTNRYILTEIQRKEMLP